MAAIALQVVAQEELLLILKAVLSRHGAVPMSSRLLGFASQDDAPGAAVVLDRASSVLSLRHEMRSPFAAWLARQVCQIRPIGKLMYMVSYNIVND